MLMLTANTIEPKVENYLGLKGPDMFGVRVHILLSVFLYSKPMSRWHYRSTFLFNCALCCAVVKMKIPSTFYCIASWFSKHSFMSRQQKKLLIKPVNFLCILQKAFQYHVPWWSKRDWPSLGLSHVYGNTIFLYYVYFFRVILFKSPGV